MKEYTKTVIKSFLKVPLMFLLIFLLAGRLDYWQGWVFSITILVLMVVMLIIFKDKMDLFKERLSPGSGIKWWGKIFWGFFAVSYSAVLITGPLDGGRYMWTTSLPIYAYVIGYVTYLLSIIIVIWAMWENKWFSSVVRIQKDRKQKVVQTGPYKYVRHPGYVGGFLWRLEYL